MKMMVTKPDLFTQVLRYDWVQDKLSSVGDELLRFGLRIDQVIVVNHVTKVDSDLKRGSLQVTLWTTPLKNPILVVFDYEISKDDSNYSHVKMSQGRGTISFRETPFKKSLKLRLESEWRTILLKGVKDWLEWSLPDLSGENTGLLMA